MSHLEKTGLCFLTTILLLSGMSMFLFEINGFNYTGYVWTLQYAIGIALLAMVHLSRGYPGSAACWRPWMIWCSLLFVSLLWTKDINRFTLQDTAELTMPIVVGMVASATIRTRAGLTRLLHVFWIPFICLAVFTKHYAEQVADTEWQWVATIEGYNVRSTALTVSLIGCVFFAGFPRRRFVPLAVWGACLVLTTLTSSRMAALVLLAAPVLHPLYPSKRWNLWAAGGMTVVGLALLFTPMFQQHFFESGSGSLAELSKGDIIDNGRFYAWNRVWDQSLEHPLIGAGVGSANDFVDAFWGDATTRIHNDYLRIFFEVGLVGITLFAGLIIWQFRTLYQLINSTGGVLRMAFTGVWLGFAGLLISSLTDNTISYHIYFTNPLFAILGAAYGVYLTEHPGYATVFGRQTTASRYGRGTMYGQPEYSNTIN